MSIKTPISLALALLLAACQPPSPSTAEPPAESASPAAFEDASVAAGLDFVHWNGMTGERYFAEMVGPGGALVDCDRDGDLDFFLIQGAMLGAGKRVEDAVFPPRHPMPPHHRLYRNDSERPGGPLALTDLTENAVPPARGYGMGVAAGDYDRDGQVDLYVTSLGSNQLLRNLGDCRFADVTAEAGVDDPRWSVSAVFADVDRDGWLDLMVTNYVDYTIATNKRCRAATGALDYCGPHSYDPEPDRLLRNRGDGSFEDVTARAGIDREYGAALGVVAADVDRDGWVDLYVANDGSANQMWINRGDGTFENRALLAGSALNRDGHPEAGMGVDAGDVDNDGDEDLFLSHLSLETNTLYRNTGRGEFEDVTATSGLGAPSWEATGFGTKLFDYDNDGLLDVLVANGAVKVIPELVSAGDPYPLHQKNQLFRNLGGGRFEETTARAGEVFALSEVSRGAAFGDVDNDGDTDVLLLNNAGPARLLLNRVGQDRHWLGARLLDREGRPDPEGAWVELVRDAEPVLWRRAGRGGSYASASDPRVLFGLGDDARVSEVRVTWPDGTRESFPVDAADRYLTLKAGTGAPLS